MRLDSSSSRAMALVRTNEKPWRGQSIRASCAAVAKFDGRTNRTKTQFISMETPAILKHTNRAAVSASASCYWLLLFLLPCAVCCCCCLLLGVDAPAHIVGPHTRYTKHTVAAKTDTNPMLSVFCRSAALLLCCCITHEPPGTVHAALCVLSFVTAMDGASVCICMCALLYVRVACAPSCYRRTYTNYQKEQ